MTGTLKKFSPSTMINGLAIIHTIFFCCPKLDTRSKFFSSTVFVFNYGSI